jgi:hypothetical protein
MKQIDNKTLLLIFTLFFAVILCGSVSASNNVIDINISVLSKPVTTNNVLIQAIYPKKIDSGVTNCYWFKGSKYYWTTYL